MRPRGSVLAIPLAACLFGVSVATRTARDPPLLAAEAPGAEALQTPEAGSFTGPGSCAAASCHGAVRPAAGSRILQTEYSTWIVQDRHAKATAVLSNPVSVRMARILGLPRADAAPKCLACHALDVPEAQRARSFADEGVSCEACHGPASGWLGPHTTRGWTHAQSVKLGMYDTKDPVRRAERCLSCHLGDETKSVDHEMIAAGHPDLVFDLEAFSAAMPRHWQENPQNDPWRTARTWATGQLVQLGEGLKRLARRANGPVWPEYAELDCFSCHHGLARADESWRQEQGYRNRRPGNPPWNHARVVVARHVIRLLDSSAIERFDADIAKLAQEVSKIQGDRRAIADAATRLARELDTLARRAAGATVDGAAARALVRAIAGDADAIAAHGERAAEQAVMSIEVLSRAHAGQSKDGDTEWRAALDRLFEQLQNPSGFDPRRFAGELKKLSALLR
jgi:hypothetical protein